MDYTFNVEIGHLEYEIKTTAYSDQEAIDKLWRIIRKNTKIHQVKKHRSAGAKKASTGKRFMQKIRSILIL